MIFYVFLSIIYLHIVYALDADISAINVNRFKGLVIGMPYLIIFSLFLSFCFMRIKRYSLSLLVFFSLFIFYKSFSIFIINFDKLILVLNVIYILISFNIYILFREELTRSIYQPNFETGSLDVELYRKVEVELINEKTAQVVRGKLVNFDDKSLVIYTKDTNIKGVLNLTLKYKKSIFSAKAKVMTKFRNGIGLQVLPSSSQDVELDWKEFYTIKEARGFV